MRLKKIEKRIIEIKQILADKGREKAMASGVAMPIFEGRLKKENRPLLEELDQLTTERTFILDKRENLFWKAVWNVVVPILVAVITAFFTTKLLSD